MTRSRFEAINAFFHIVTPQEEAANGNDPLKKVQTFYDAVKAKCMELYQPLQQLSADEGIVKPKGRTHFHQFICNKPMKCGFKFWVLADSTGLTSDCSLLWKATWKVHFWQQIGLWCGHWYLACIWLSEVFSTLHQLCSMLWRKRSLVLQVQSV